MTIDDLKGPKGLAFARRVAARLDHLRPAHMDRDDLDGAAALGLCQALATYDPARGTKPATWCGRRMVGAVKDAIRAETGRAGTARAARAARPIQIPVGVVMTDARQADPAEIAAAREAVLAPAGRHALGAGLPGPAAVAARVTELRAAMFAAVAPADVTGVMAAVVEKAKGGNLGAAKLLIDLLAPGKSGVTVQQQAVIVQRGDLG